ncbi:MAG: hypothetical protein JWM81_138 [Candidatus Saccharibacteria bacterium]|nr:hypothetical protein [Candidatus Saccharibacteria bacterium]
MAQSKVVVIGGGTGSYTLLQSLKFRKELSITALVAMADDGGSTGVLRDELGVLPPGDIRQCLVALSDASQELRDLFNFRFPTGSFEGHSFGNIFLSAVETMTNNFEDAVRMAGDVLNIQGRVLPMTLDNCKLSMQTEAGVVHGQRAIELTMLPPHTHPDIFFDGPATINTDAAKAIAEADMVVIAPGNLYGSLAPALTVDGVAGALAAAKAQVIFVCNLVNKPNHTADFDVNEYVAELERLTTPGIIDAVLYNINVPDEELLSKYALEQEYPVTVMQAAFSGASYQAIGGNYLSTAPIARNQNDTFIRRSLIRHDAEAVANTLVDLLA